MSAIEHGPRRRPAAGGYARGEATRARIVAAAIKVFGEEGYEGASTRRIAEEADVKPAALQYYFDSKEGLHRACGEEVIRYAAGLLEALRAAEAAVDRLSPPEAALAFCELMDTIVDISIDKRSDAARSRFMARIQSDGAGPALEVIRQALVRPVHAACARLVAAALGGSPDEPALRLRAALLLSQVSAVHAQRENTFLFMGWSDFEGERRRAIKTALRANILAALRS